MPRWVQHSRSSPTSMVLLGVYTCPEDVYAFGVQIWCVPIPVLPVYRARACAFVYRSSWIACNVCHLGNCARQSLVYVGCVYQAAYCVLPVDTPVGMSLSDHCTRRNSRHVLGRGHTLGNLFWRELLIPRSKASAYVNFTIIAA